MYFPRSAVEEQQAIAALPKDLGMTLVLNMLPILSYPNTLRSLLPNLLPHQGNENGEPVIEERQIRISDGLPIRSGELGILSFSITINPIPVPIPISNNQQKSLGLIDQAIIAWSKISTPSHLEP